MNGTKSVQVVVVTPERTVLDAAVDFVSLPMYDGELGVLPGRAPLIGRLGAGELRTRKGTVTERFFIDGGFAQVRADVVTVLTARAIKAEEIDQQAANNVLQNPPPGEGRQKAQDRARIQLRVARKAAESAV
ncbi:MAG: ATP synthase F1 subunit epsilon [Planctomycetia bacterium]|nr:ATP synthase F1 subunit epsilon [Planctomycetia bacterium]